MVARIKIGKSIRGILNYNENKVEEGTANCIDAVGFGMETNELSFAAKLSRFKNLTERNKLSRTNALHISLNFFRTENLSEETLKQIAASYMEKIGFGDQPYLVYKHEDAAHPHLHIATVNIKENGDPIHLHNIGRNKSEPARKQIEEEFGLVRAEDHKKELNTILKPADLKKALYGKTETKSAISNIVRTVYSYYKYTCLKEYNDILKQFNVIADQGNPGTRMFMNGGLVYQLINKKGKKVGVPIKASSIYDKPTLLNLEKKFALNHAKRKQYIPRIARTIDKILPHISSQEGFIRALQKENIHAEFKKNETGHIYGLTFTDHLTCCHFNGSDIGKNYSANSILNRLSQDRVGTSCSPGHKEFEPVLRLPTKNSSSITQALNELTETISTESSKIVSDLIHAEETPTNLPPELLKEAKKKKRKRSR